MPVNLAAIPSLLRPGLFRVSGLYEKIPNQWSPVFETSQSKMSFELTTQARYLGAAAIKNEGQAGDFDNAAGQRYVYNMRHSTIFLGYAITAEAVEDDLYKSQFDPMNLGLLASFAQTKNILAANVLNTATTYNANVGGDGVALLATTHPYDNGTWANTFSVQLDLNESALEQADTAIRNYPDQAGLRILAMPDLLTVPRQLRYTAERLTKSELRVGTANNDINALISTGTYTKYHTMDFLTSAYSWFIKTKLPTARNGLRHLERIKFSTDVQIDPTTTNVLVMGRERYFVGYDDPAAIFGSTPSS